MSFAVRFLSITLIAAALTTTAATVVTTTPSVAVAYGDEDDSWGWG